MPKAETFIFAGGLALIAAALAMAAWSWSETAQTRSWATAEGRVIESRTQFQQVQTRRGHGLTYTPVVRYTYEVGGARLTGERVYPGTPRQWAHEAELAAFLAATYPPGAAIPVRYNPENPRETALIIESDYSWTWVLAPTGLWFCVMGWGIRALMRRRAEAETRPA